MDEPASSSPTPSSPACMERDAKPLSECPLPTAMRGHLRLARDVPRGARDEWEQVVVSAVAGVRPRTTGAAAYALDGRQVELLDTLSHELRSPLSAITGFAQTLLRHDALLVPQERQAFLGAIEDASGRLALSIEQLLMLAQREMGLVTLHPFPLELAELARGQSLRSMDTSRCHMARGWDRSPS